MTYFLLMLLMTLNSNIHPSFSGNKITQCVKSRSMYVCTWDSEKRINMGYSGYCFSGIFDTCNVNSVSQVNLWKTMCELSFISQWQTNAKPWGILQLWKNTLGWMPSRTNFQWILFAGEKENRKMEVRWWGISTMKMWHEERVLFNSKRTDEEQKSFMQL